MRPIKYFFQFSGIIFLFIIFRIIGLRVSKIISSFIFKKIGPLFRSKKIAEKNLSIVFPQFNELQKDKIRNLMWENYGKIFAEYIFIKKFRKDFRF